METPGFSRFVDVEVGDAVANEQLPIPFGNIQERTDIHSRRIAHAEDTIASLSVTAGHKLFAVLGIDGRDCGGLILASCSGSRREREHLDANARQVASLLGISSDHVASVDYACTGFPKAVERGLEMAQHADRHIVIITTEIMSRIVNWNEEATAILFGDRTAATTIINDGHEILDAASWEVDDPAEWLHLDHLDDALNVHGENHPHDCIRMNGKALYRHAPDAMVKLIEHSLTKTNSTFEDVSMVVPHQANGRFMQKIQKILEAKYGAAVAHLWIVNAIEQMANVGAASIPNALASVEESLQPGKIVMCPSIGAGPAFKRGTLSEGILSFRVSS